MINESKIPVQIRPKLDLTPKTPPNKKIAEINDGDKLRDGSRVAAKFKLSYTGEDIYIIRNIKVTGSHKIYHNNELIYHYKLNENSLYSYRRQCNA